MKLMLNAVQCLYKTLPRFLRGNLAPFFLLPPEFIVVDSLIVLSRGPQPCSTSECFLNMADETSAFHLIFVIFSKRYSINQWLFALEQATWEFIRKVYIGTPLTYLTVVTATQRERQSGHTRGIVFEGLFGIAVATDQSLHRWHFPRRPRETGHGRLPPQRPQSHRGPVALHHLPELRLPQPQGLRLLPPGLALFAPDTEGLRQGGNARWPLFPRHLCLLRAELPLILQGKSSLMWDRLLRNGDEEEEEKLHSPAVSKGSGFSETRGTDQIIVARGGRSRRASGVSPAGRSSTGMPCLMSHLQSPKRGPRKETGSQGEKEPPIPLQSCAKHRDKRSLFGEGAGTPASWAASPRLGNS
ncbi:uncharacterized protein LOC125435554 [Sphaerodactylus townsendi]|uniref:uncharacterized protein LOC125435554 n=1 Tax=Sphaerodactylus townsendi TaxID=933632 RepID=UPI002026BEF8|nr:uncharacterized protein LOC125435554 [Sphaerodactylus townsendi]